MIKSTKNDRSGLKQGLSKHSFLSMRMGQMFRYPGNDNAGVPVIFPGKGVFPAYS
jgi:hypothetical protein